MNIERPIFRLTLTLVVSFWYATGAFAAVFAEASADLTVTIISVDSSISVSGSFFTSVSETGEATSLASGTVNAVDSANMTVNDDITLSAYAAAWSPSGSATTLTDGYFEMSNSAGVDATITFEASYDLLALTTATNPAVEDGSADALVTLWLFDEAGNLTDPITGSSISFPGDGVIAHAVSDVDSAPGVSEISDTVSFDVTLPGNSKSVLAMAFSDSYSTAVGIPGSPSGAAAVPEPGGMANWLLMAIGLVAVSLPTRVRAIWNSKING